MTALTLPRERAAGRLEAFAGRHGHAALFAALTALAAAPAFLWQIPRGNDIVNHWARLTLYAAPPGDPLWRFYHLHFGLIPNLAMDLIYLALSPWLSPLAAIRLVVALAVALPALGAYALHRAAFARPSPSLWIVPYLSFNVATSVGLLNFALGAGVAFLGVAYAMRRPPQLTVRDILVLNAIGAAVFFCHLIALAMFFCLLAGTLGLPLRGPRRDLLTRAALALAAVAGPLALVALSPHPPSTFQLQDVSKTSLLLAPVETWTAWNGAMEAVLVGLVALAFAGGVRIAPRAGLALAAFVLLATTIFAYRGAATLIDARLKVYVWYYALAVLAAPASGWRASLRPAVAIAAGAATLWRVIALAPAYDDFQAHAALVRGVLAALPEGSRALVVKHPECAYDKNPLYVNMTAFAVIDRHSYVNTLFAMTGMQPVAPNNAVLDGGPTLAMEDSWLEEVLWPKLGPYVTKAPWAPAFLDWRRHFSHVIDVHADCPEAELKTPGLAKIAGAPGFDLYEIR